MKVGIIGAGTMGSGIAQAFAQVDGYEVCLCDINEEFASNGKLKITKNFEKRVAKGKMAKEDADKILARIHTGVKTICSDCDLVVEAEHGDQKTDLQRAGRYLQGRLRIRYQHLFSVHY